MHERSSAWRPAPFRPFFRLLIATALAGPLTPVLAAPTAPAPTLNGNWEVTAAEAAPWAPAEQQRGLSAAAKAYLTSKISFAAKEIVSKQKTLACKRAVYEPSSYEADALFQGNMPSNSPTQVATKLGFSRGEIRSVDVRCRSGQFVYHFRDKDTALTTLNNLILTLQRR